MRLLGRVTLVRPVHPENAQLPMEVTGRLLMVFGMSKKPEAFGLEPVMVMVESQLTENNNSADREVEEKRRREKKQAVEFLGKGNRKAKIDFI